MMSERREASYLDFELKIDPGVGQEYPVSVINSPAGEARETMHFPFDDLALENRLQSLQIALLRSGGKRRRVNLPEEQAVQDFGRDLFEALLCGEVRSRFAVSLRDAAGQGKGLRVKLRIQSPELAALPWEFMFDERQGEYLCLSRNTPVVRYIELPRSIQPQKVKTPLCILGMIADPSDLPSLDVEREKQRIEKAVENLQAEGLLELTWLPGQTWRDLHRAMGRGGPWHIFHFIGHGGFDAERDEGLICLADEAGEKKFMSATQLGRLLADHGSLRFVLLNSCEGARGGNRDIFSSSASILVRRGIPAVLAMQYEITDRAAVEFARTFYEFLTGGLPIDTSAAEARKAVSFAVTNTLEWGTPVLYMRSPDGILFSLDREPKERKPPKTPVATKPAEDKTPPLAAAEPPPAATEEEPLPGLEILPPLEPTPPPTEVPFSLKTIPGAEEPALEEAETPPAVPEPLPPLELTLEPPAPSEPTLPLEIIQGPPYPAEPTPYTPEPPPPIGASLAEEDIPSPAPMLPSPGEQIMPGTAPPFQEETGAAPAVTPHFKIPESKRGTSFKRLLPLIVILGILVVILYFIFRPGKTGEETKVGGTETPAVQDSRETGLPEGREVDFSKLETFNDPNGYYSLSLPEGYNKTDSSSFDRSKIDFSYTDRTSISIVAHSIKEDWKADDEMKKKVREIESGTAGTLSLYTITGYKLINIGDASGYELMLKRTGILSHYYFVVNPEKNAVLITLFLEGTNRQEKHDNLVTTITESLETF